LLEVGFFKKSSQNVTTVYLVYDKVEEAVDELAYETPTKLVKVKKEVQKKIKQERPIKKGNIKKEGSLASHEQRKRAISQLSDAQESKSPETSRSGQSAYGLRSTSHVVKD
jgi:hypothetical protein